MNDCSGGPPCDVEQLGQTQSKDAPVVLPVFGHVPSRILALVSDPRYAWACYGEGESNALNGLGLTVFLRGGWSWQDLHKMRTAVVQDTARMRA